MATFRDQVGANPINQHNNPSDVINMVNDATTEDVPSQKNMMKLFHLCTIMCLLK